MKTLTVGIPTYKRKKSIENLVKDLVSYKGLDSEIEILVIDNASKDGTVESLNKISQEKPNIRILENTENIGFGGNFNRLFQEANGKYILTMSDEDQLIKENLDQLIEYLKIKCPMFLSTQFIRDLGHGNFVYMGRNKNRPIKSGEFHASSFYISGSIYSVKESRPLIGKIYNEKLEFLSAFIYPHSLLSALLLLKYNNSCWYKYPTVKENYNFEPNFTMKDDSKYNSIANRWKQYFGFIDYFESYRETGLSVEEDMRLNDLLENHKKKLFYWLRWGVSTNNKDYIDYFDFGAMNFFFDTFKFRMTQILNKIFRHKLYLKEKYTTIPTKATWRLTRKK